MNLETMLDAYEQRPPLPVFLSEDFSNRYHNQQPIALHEFIYQGSSGIRFSCYQGRCEDGGKRRISNLLAGRDLSDRTWSLGALTMPCL